MPPGFTVTVVLPPGPTVMDNVEPVPVSVSDCRGLTGSLLVMFSVAVSAPVVVGVNTTLIVQLDPVPGDGVSGAVQLFVCVKSGVSLSSEIEIFDTVRFALPELVIVTFWGALEEPIPSPPNATVLPFAGFSVATGAGGTMFVGSEAVALADPPPDTVTEFVNWEGAVWDTLTVTVIAG